MIPIPALKEQQQNIAGRGWMQRNKCETGRNQIKAGGEFRWRRRWREELLNEGGRREEEGSVLG